MDHRHEIDEDSETQEARTANLEVPAKWQPNRETIKAMQNGIEKPENEPISQPKPEGQPGHLVPATTVENVNTVLDEKKSRELSERQYPNRSVDQLPDTNLRGVTYEGMVLRDLEDRYGPDHIETHPEAVSLADGRRIEPDFAIIDNDGHITELHDAKGYTRKETQSPEAAASKLTNMSDLKQASRYVDADDPNIRKVVLDMPRETADMEAVQKGVAEFSSGDRSVAVEGAGSEAEIKQRMADLRKSPEQRFTLSDNVVAEIKRIQALPPADRREAMGELVLSLRDDKTDETTDGRNLRWSARIERNGQGVTIIDPVTGEEYTVWYP